MKGAVQQLRVVRRKIRSWALQGLESVCWQKPAAVYLKSKPSIASSSKMSDELDMDLERFVCAVIRVLSWCLPGGLSKTTKILGIAGVMANMRIKIQNTSAEQYHYTSLFDIRQLLGINRH
jgi:hypothetical protein